MSILSCFSMRLRRTGVSAAAAVLLSLVVALPALAQQSLTVGLYPWVPRLAQFEQAITAAWAQVEPNVQLVFLTADQWDGGYDMNPPANADVFVFDAMFFQDFLGGNYLEAMTPAEIQNANDLIPYARDGVQSNGNYYAIPLLGCSNVLFYQKGDQQLAAATTFNEVSNALNQCTYTSQIPPDRRGLMTDMSGGTTNAALYLDIAHAMTGTYPLPLPPTPQDLNTNAIAEQKTMLATASYFNATVANDNSYQQSIWFSEGFGRAVVGYTESMSQMSDATRANIAFKVMPFGDGTEQPLFYADVISVNTTTSQRNTRTLAVKLANLMASTDVVVDSIGATATEPVPQYLMATRASVFQQLSQQFPLYQDMWNMVNNANPLMFALAGDARSWLDAMKNVIKTDVRSNYQCGCDFKASQTIANNNAAPAICSSTCQPHGGWNGQWTNAYPAAQDGSVCGCNACPLPAASLAEAAPASKAVGGPKGKND
ncbi:carbohydrate ABC transporter substrate-binding protein (CUT1 family) [Breoghania corrubedonensis]|uniref:Carbohydrate ABC transporter substrate-binding protein (CUT1 family) n=1 Tax=Breoghania corrubedonensis TaxID=665038 RepID=A0A2T5VDD1_9HYPH|nr:thiamine pyridinylase [Breoghania corrubedonensis]PTW61760.1 carbohydrate ABC transporter substrate-binding protein (CUT1 family) [Breoghania corrubedonensis]